MAAANLPITQASGPTHHVRNEQVGTQGGLPIIAQVVLAGAHKRTYKGVQSLVLSGVAQALTVPAGATLADVYAEGDTANSQARYWHGAAPTAVVGKRLRDHEEIGSSSPADFQAINQTGVTTLRVEYAAHD